MVTPRKFGTVRILPTRTLVSVIVEGRTIKLPEGSTDANVFHVIRPFVPFTDYVLGYTGPKDRATVVVERIVPGEPVDAADKRLAAKVRLYAEPN